MSPAGAGPTLGPPGLWLAPSAVDLVGRLPTRAGAAPYPARDLSGIDMLVCHYLGDPAPGGSLDGFGDIPPERTAAWQTGPTAGLAFPEIAYHFYITTDGTLYQCLDIRKRSWHAGTANNRGVAVLLTGFGRLGRPNAVQLRALGGLWRALAAHLGRAVQLVGHRHVHPSECPGDRVDEWLAEVRRHGRAG